MNENEKQLYDLIIDAVSTTSIEFMTGHKISLRETDIEKLKLEIENSYLLGFISLMQYGVLLKYHYRLKFFWGLLNYK